MSKAKNLPIAEDIYQRQEKIIEEQREQINNLNRHISYLESVQAEFDEFKGAFNGNGLTTFNQAMQVILTRRNAEVERERQRRN